MQKITALVLIAVAAFGGASASIAQPAAGGEAVAPPAAPRPRASPHETISGYAAGNRQTGSLVTITYGRPFSAPGGKGEARKIWGGLVKWEVPDRLGADEATTILTRHTIEIGGATIPAGIYTLYIVPSETGVSKLAFSSAVGKWGIPVDTTKDVARVDLKKDSLSTSVDQLTLALDSTPTGGVIKIAWEKTQFSVPFTIKR
jgi:hypothetical protein